MKTMEKTACITGQVKKIPSFVDSIGYIESGKTDYLTYYDFTKCPVDVSRYPFLVHLDTYQITRTERGLEDAIPILNDILHNVYKQVSTIEDKEVDAILRDTKQLFESLHTCFIGECRRQFEDDFDKILIRAKWWTMHTWRCLSSAFTDDVFQKSDSPAAEYGIPENRVDAWQRCNYFRKAMSEYCICLTVESANKNSSNPYKDVHRVVPFNYYGDDYDKVVSSAQKKHLKTDKERVATEYLANCKYFLPYLENRLAALDGKDINDPYAAEVKDSVAKDLIKMADSYLGHVEEAGVTDPATQRYAIELWGWIVRETINYLTDSDFSCYSPSKLSSAEDSRMINNTSAQYSSFRTTFNRMFVKSESEFIRDCIKRMAVVDIDTDASIDESTEEIIDEISTPGPKKGRPRKSFEGCVIITDEADKLLKVLHSMLDGKSGEGAYQILYAAMKRGLIIKPSYNSVMDEFSISGSESGFNAYFAKYALSNDEIDPIVARIKQEMANLT